MFVFTEDLKSQTGYGVVVRNLYKALGKYMEVQCGTEFEERFIKALTKDDFILVRPFFQNPFRFNTEAQIIGHYALESTKLPERLVRECNDDRMVQVWVPSNYVKSIAVSNGIIEDKLKVIPHGYNPDIFHDYTEHFRKNENFQFLFVGGYTGKGDRKGADLIAEASRLLYGHTTQPFVVKFKINTTYGVNYTEIYQDLAAPHHILDFENYPDEKMGDIYNSADCFITASSGEAFNMTLLEAMACGLPAISPLNTGERDFATQIDYPLLEFQEVPARYTPWDNGNWFRPDIGEIKDKMNAVIKAMPVRRSYNLVGYTWDEVAKKVVECLNG